MNHFLQDLPSNVVPVNLHVSHRTPGFVSTTKNTVVYSQGSDSGPSETKKNQRIRVMCLKAQHFY